MKKIISLVLSTLMCVSLAACSSTTDTATDTTAPATTATATEGKVLNIYAWNTEFQDRFNDYYADKIPSDVTVNWIITPNEGNAYQNKLDETLLNQDSAAADDKIDIFLIEADYALKYVNSDYTMNIKDLGITDADIADQYAYTKEITTDSTGAIKGLSWQATHQLDISIVEVLLKMY